MTKASPEMREYEVVNGKRRIRFEGELLATSTSWEQGADRWVEFALYRTASGNYVLSRIGRSVLLPVSEQPSRMMNMRPPSSLRRYLGLILAGRWR